MKRYALIFLLAATLMQAVSFSKEQAVKAVNHLGVKDQTQLSCTDQFYEAMHEMHSRMQEVTSSGDVDEDFVRMMLPHHEAAVEMGKVELLCGKDGINRRLAQEIIADQQSEIELMRLWLKQHDSRSSARNGQKKEARP